MKSNKISIFIIYLFLFLRCEVIQTSSIRKRKCVLEPNSYETCIAQHLRPQTMRNRSLYASLVALFCFLVLMIVTPAIPQSQEYHNFADHRKFLGNPLHFLLCFGFTFRPILFLLFTLFSCFAYFQMGRLKR